MGASGAALTLNEYDGYLILDDGNGNMIHLPWHVLPRKAAEVKAKPKNLKFKGGPVDIELDNKGVGTAQNDAYSLLGTSKNLPEGKRGEQNPTPDLKAVGINTFPVPAGFCSGQPSFIWAFAVNTWERFSHSVVPAYYWFDLDIDQDGILDYGVFNWDLSAPLSTVSDGRNVVWALDYSTFSASAFFFTEQAVNTGNTAFYICGEQVGLTGTDMLSTNVDIQAVYAFDNYFGGDFDVMGPFTVTPLGEQYYGIPSDVPGNSKGTMTVVDFGPFPGNTPEEGLMLFTNGDRGAGNRGGATEKTEALIFKAK
jgi:hypothetical protein